MSGRYQSLFRLRENQYLSGSPVLLAAGALLKDTQTGKILVQLKLQNLHIQTILVCKVRIHAFEPGGAEVRGVEAFSYLDLHVTQGKEFGQKTPIYLPANTTRSFTVSVTEVVFTDESVWRSEENALWIPLPDPSSLEEHFPDPQIREQYRIEIDGDDKILPQKTAGIWFCACGTINLEHQEWCRNCKRSFVDLIQAMDEASLTEKKEERIAMETAAQEKAEAIRKEHEEAAKRKRKKRTKVVFICTAVIVTVAVLSFTVVIPYFQYKNAEKLFLDGNYIAAAEAFHELNNYSDSSERAKDSYYENAFSETVYQTSLRK